MFFQDLFGDPFDSTRASYQAAKEAMAAYDAGAASETELQRRSIAMRNALAAPASPRKQGGTKVLPVGKTLTGGRTYVPAAATNVMETWQRYGFRPTPR